MTTDLDDLADRQVEAQMRILHVLRELNLVDIPSICPIIAALTASMLMRVLPKDRPEVAQELDRHIAHFGAHLPPVSSLITTREMKP